MPEIVYLAHFSRPLRHAQHYIGLTNNLDRRELEHRTGRGSRLLAIVAEQGIEWEIVRTWEFPDRKSARQHERHLKVRRKSSRSLCPVCRAEYLAQKSERERRKYAERKTLNSPHVLLVETPHVE